MQKIGKLEHATKVVALCVPPVVMSLIGLQALSRKKGRAVVVASKQSQPARPVTQRTGAG
jgi:hypothetical protein